MTIEPDLGVNRTLVVDDHGISCRFAVNALRYCSGEVRQARSAREALALSLSWYPDLICIDFHLPGSNGLEVVRTIRRDWPSHRSRPRVIIMTGDDSVVKQSDLVELSIDGVLLKPVSGRQLRKAAGLQENSRVSESGPLPHDRELDKLFREELETRLPELDRCISDFDRDRAGAILHQLIASGAMCRERDMEKRLRVLNTACRQGDSTADLARAYYALIESANEFLSRPVFSRNPS